MKTYKVNVSVGGYKILDVTTKNAKNEDDAINSVKKLVEYLVEENDILGCWYGQEVTTNNTYYIISMVPVLSISNLADVAYSAQEVDNAKD